MSLYFKIKQHAPLDSQIFHTDLPNLHDHVSLQSTKAIEEKKQKEEKQKEETGGGQQSWPPEDDSGKSPKDMERTEFAGNMRTEGVSIDTLWQWLT